MLKNINQPSKALKINFVQDNSDINDAALSDPSLNKKLNESIEVYGNIGKIDFEYTYDLMDNRLNETTSKYSSTEGSNIINGTESENYVYGSDHRYLTEDDKFIYTYDEDGFLVKKSIKNTTIAWIYTWDAAGYLREVNKLDGSKTGAESILFYEKYIYDESGMRIKTESASSSAVYAYNGNKVIYEKKIEGTEAKITDYVYCFNELICVESEGKILYYYSDILGSTRMISDAEGVINQENIFTPFGKELLNTFADSKDILRYRWAGHEEQNENTGLTYMIGRWMDNEIGRFISPDPMQQGINWYVYCSNNPTTLIDPSGLTDYSAAKISFMYHGSGENYGYDIFKAQSGAALSDIGMKLFNDPLAYKDPTKMYWDQSRDPASLREGEDLYISSSYGMTEQAYVKKNSMPEQIYYVKDIGIVPENLMPYALMLNEYAQIEKAQKEKKYCEYLQNLPKYDILGNTGWWAGNAQKQESTILIDSAVKSAMNDLARNNFMLELAENSGEETTLTRKGSFSHLGAMKERGGGASFRPVAELSELNYEDKLFLLEQMQKNGERNLKAMLLTAAVTGFASRVNTTASAVSMKMNAATKTGVINKNSNVYVGPQAVYDIKADGQLLKYGKADLTNISSTGNPIRLQSQLNKLQRLNPNARITGEVLYQNPSISTYNIKQIETQYIQQFYNKYGYLPPLNPNHPGIIK